jgi:hypothetical protein
MTTKAVINGDRIECGQCGALIAKKKNKAKINQLAVGGYIKGEIGNEQFILEIKCTHKDKGKKCGAINEILL